MMLSLSVNYQGFFVVTETPDSSSAPSVSDVSAARSYDKLNFADQISSGSTLALYPYAIDISQTLAGTNTDIDLTAAPLATDISKTIDLTGKKLVGYAFLADKTNGGNITIKPHPTTNAYDLFVGSGEARTLGPGRHLISMLPNDGAAEASAIDATHKVIRIVGANTYKIKGLLVFK